MPCPKRRGEGSAEKDGRLRASWRPAGKKKNLESKDEKIGAFLQRAVLVCVAHLSLEMTALFIYSSGCLFFIYFFFGLPVSFFLSSPPFISCAVINCVDLSLD